VIYVCIHQLSHTFECNNQF